MSALVFMDTETTGLALTDDIWEFAGIRREEDGSQTNLHLFITHDEAKCASLPLSFRDDHMARWDAISAVTQAYAATAIGMFMADRAHVVGAVPNFDTERISLLLSRFGIVPQWHYHLIDVENLAVGYLNGRCREVAATSGFVPTNLSDGALTPPWDSDELSRLCGVEPPTHTRHTAMGDAVWAMAIYDRIMGSTS
jgi:hypothetical protein